jgi:hypothetical protein
MQRAKRLSTSALMQVTEPMWKRWFAAAMGWQKTPYWLMIPSNAHHFQVQRALLPYPT